MHSTEKTYIIKNIAHTLQDSAITRSCDFKTLRARELQDSHEVKIVRSHKISSTRAEPKNFPWKTSV